MQRRLIQALTPSVEAAQENWLPVALCGPIQPLPDLELRISARRPCGSREVTQLLRNVVGWSRWSIAILGNARASL
ncbi:MAG TPA: hypothetical protein VGF67_01695 [Ktedonobacteraceae bacterium]